MIEIGLYNQLAAVRDTPHGMVLGDESGNEVLLPRKFVPEDFELGQLIDVFIYNDSEERPVATTEHPLAVRDQFAFLTVKEISDIGAWMDIGVAKDLLVPFSEQSVKMETGKAYPVYVYLDEQTSRLVGSSRLHRFLDDEGVALEIGEEVGLFIIGLSELGAKAVVDGKYEGLIFESDIFRPLQAGDRLRGFVKAVREDGKIDLALQPQGYSSVEPNAEKILDKLRAAGGFLPLHDKSDPDLIRAELQMSKKIFKKAVGSLYKQRLIELSEDGIRLVE